MKREKILEAYSQKLADDFRTMTMVREIERGVPIWFDYRTWIRCDGNYKNSKWETRPYAAVIIEFNNMSFRVELIANDESYKDYRHRSGCPLDCADFRRIMKWRYLKAEDLPLLISCECKYPLLEILMKEGMDAWKNPKNRYKAPDKTHRL